MLITVNCQQCKVLNTFANPIQVYGYNLVFISSDKYFVCLTHFLLTLYELSTYSFPF